MQKDGKIKFYLFDGGKIGRNCVLKDDLIRMFMEFLWGRERDDETRESLREWMKEFSMFSSKKGWESVWMKGKKRW